MDGRQCVADVLHKHFTEEVALWGTFTMLATRIYLGIQVTPAQGVKFTNPKIFFYNFTYSYAYNTQYRVLESTV